MKQLTTLLAVLTILVVASGDAAQAADDTFPPQIQALKWRNNGPFNGGRGTTVVGHPKHQAISSSRALQIAVVDV